MVGPQRGRWIGRRLQRPLGSDQGLKPQAAFQKKIARQFAWRAACFGLLALLSTRIQRGASTMTT
jgi:hypothetical protein